MARCVRDLLLIGVLVLAGCDGSGQIAVGDDDDDTSDDDTWDDIQVDDVSYRLHDEIESLVYVTWTQEIPALASVEYRIDAEQWRSTPPRHL